MNQILVLNYLGVDMPLNKLNESTCYNIRADLWLIYFLIIEFNCSVKKKKC